MQEQKMALYQEIKDKLDAARKSGNLQYKTLLVTLLGEIQRTLRTPKDDVTDSMVLVVVKRMIASADETIVKCTAANLPFTQSEYEKSELTKFIPVVVYMSTADVTALITKLIAENSITMSTFGVLMGLLKQSTTPINLAEATAIARGL
jgi:uncharacterized protein YqeY